MNNRFVLILSLVASIFYLIYMVLDYNGYIREWHLTHFASVHPYLESYAKLPKGDKNKIVVCITNAGKLDKIKQTVLSILDQSIRVDAISVSTINGLPINSKHLPPDLVKTVTLFPYNGYGKIDSLIQVLLRETDGNTKIIVIPNKVMVNDSIEHIVDASNKYPDNIIRTDNGTLVKPKFFSCNILNNPPDTDLDLVTWLNKWVKIPIKVEK
jgi:hypothetical protein